MIKERSWVDNVGALRWKIVNEYPGLPRVWTNGPGRMCLVGFGPGPGLIELSQGNDRGLGRQDLRGGQPPALQGSWFKGASHGGGGRAKLHGLGGGREEKIRTVWGGHQWLAEGRVAEKGKKTICRGKKSAEMGLL